MPDPSPLTPTPELLRHVLAYIVNRVTVQPDGCWTMAGCEYPTIKIDGHPVKLHRVIYTLFVGPIPPGFVVDHECHNRDLSCVDGTACRHRRCLNPEHLCARTQGSNLAAARRAARYRRVGPPSPRPAVIPPREWVSTYDLVVTLGRVDADADEAARATAAHRLGMDIARSTGARATTPRRLPGDASRHRRGYYVADIADLLPSH